MNVTTWKPRQRGAGADGKVNQRRLRAADLGLFCLTLCCLTLGLPTVVSAVASPSQPGDSAAAPFSGRQAPVEPLGSAILNVDSGMTFADLQSAIDAATAGDTLQVQVAEHFAGQVLVDKSLTLEGQTGTEVVKMAVDTGSSGDDRAWFLVDAGVDLQVRGLTFNGDGRLIWQAFRHRGSGRFEDCIFEDIQFNAAGPDFAGTAIVAFGGDVEVVNCRFRDIGRVGVLAFGTGLTASLFTGNTYLGKGDGPHLDYGLEVGAGANVMAVGNHIHGNTGVAPDNSTSAGVLVTTFFGPGSGLDLQQNDLGDNLFSLTVGFDGTDTSTVSASLNRLAGNTMGGVNHLSTVPLPAERNWWGCNDGPGAANCDGISGSGTVTFDPWVLLQAAFGLNPAVLPVGESTTLEGSLVIDSNMAALPDDMVDGIVIGFQGGPLGTVEPATVGTLDSVAATTWTAETPGMDVATVTLDGESLDVAVEVLPAVDVIEVPTLATWGLALLITVLMTAALRSLARRRLRRTDSAAG